MYHELRRGDIVSRIKDRQHKFFIKVSQLPKDDAIVQIVLGICKSNKIITYYNSLHDHNYSDDIRTREAKLNTSNSSLSKYYMDMMFLNKSCIYNSFLNDELRCIITRWRLSNHDLLIETGRYGGVPRNERLCNTCDILEDEKHVVFVCSRYNLIRDRFRNLLSRSTDIKLFLNPSFEYMHDTAKFLLEVEALRKS